MLCLLLIATPLFAGCSSQGAAQSATATVLSTATSTAGANATVIPAVTGEPVSPTVVSSATSVGSATSTATLVGISSATVATTVQATGTPQVSATVGVTSTDVPAATLVTTVTATIEETATPENTPTLGPPPTGTPPEPMSRLNIFRHIPPGATLVKRDNVKLDGSDPDEVMFTITGPGKTITDETQSAINVLTYDPLYWRWNDTWSSEVVSGTASPLLSIGQSGIGGYNGGDLLRTGAPVLAVRTTLRDGHARLYLWRWNREKRTGEPIKMLPVGGGAERNAVFDADLDVGLADLNDDGVYEVVADNATGVQIWKWDGAKYAPEGGQR